MLNNRETTIEEREESIDILLEIMKIEGGVQEVYEMNGAVTIASVMKEELDMEVGHLSPASAAKGLRGGDRIGHVGGMIFTPYLFLS